MYSLNNDISNFTKALRFLLVILGIYEMTDFKRIVTTSVPSKQQYARGFIELIEIPNSKF